MELSEPVPVTGGDICRAWRARTAARQEVFAKSLTGAPPGLFAAEARGLERLRCEGGPPLPDVLAVADDGLVLGWVEPGPPTRQAAQEFGRALAHLHRDGGAQLFGASDPGFIATLPLTNDSCTAWPEFYAQQRVAPYLRQAVDLGALLPRDSARVERVLDRLPQLAGPPEPPARIHGDLWSGNLLWSAGGVVWLVDAASAHDGHRETDLAMLALFGSPWFDDILDSYQEVHPLAEGWLSRVSLHQIHPLLVHAVLFGGRYGARAGAAAAAALGDRSG